MTLLHRHPWLTWLLSSALGIAVIDVVLGMTWQPVLGESLLSITARWVQAIYAPIWLAFVLAIPASAVLIALQNRRATGVQVIVAALALQLLVLVWEATFVQRAPAPPLEERYSRWLKEA